jgi:hypothetical protein
MDLEGDIMMGRPTHHKTRRNRAKPPSVFSPINICLVSGIKYATVARREKVKEMEERAMTHFSAPVL